MNKITADRQATEQVQALLASLRPRLEGEARFDLYNRMLYSTDASIYQVMPLGVVLPRTKEDVHAVLEVARRFKVPITARGGGSSLEGQAIGPGIILDYSRYMNGLMEVDAERRTARVQPGLVLDDLNRELAPYGLMYGPDPASSNRATMGGIIGNDSTGSHSILYGMTHDHLHSMRVLLASGTETEIGELSQAELTRKIECPGHEGAVYRATRQLVERHREEIAARYPAHWRTVSGYGLNRLAQADSWNMSSLLAGSEGTLALTLEATVGLVPRPKRTALAMVHFHSLIEAMEATPRILEVGPAAIELLDDVLIDLTRAVPEYARKLTFVRGQPACLLIVEFYGESDRELEGHLSRLRDTLGRARTGYEIVEARTKSEIANVWGVRKAGLGLLMSTTSEWKPVAFMEDGSVPPEKLAEFVREVQRILAAHDVQAALYAHASAGCLHIRPMLNLKQAEDVARMRSITQAWSDLLLRLRGAYSGEHGDGRTLSEWNEKLFGPVIYRAFQELKDQWDPDGLLNPGIIVHAESMTENLRYGPAYRVEPLSTAISFRKTGGLAGAVEMCSGIGACRKTGEGVMCPSYRVTREEEHSTRGRANALRAALSGRIPQDELFSSRMYKVLDLCLECKACAAECPSQVDMAKIKYEFLHQYHHRHGLPLRARLFGHIRLLNRLGQATAPLSNRLARTGVVRMLLAKIGIEPRRSLPPFAQHNFYRWFEHHRPHPNAGERGQTVLFPDTFTLYNYPSMGIATTRLLEAAGYRVILPERLGCCGRPMISKGMLSEAKRNLEANIRTLLPYVSADIPIIGIEPSCLLTFRDEAVELVDTAEARSVAGGCYLIDEWLIQRQAARELDLLRWRGNRRRLLFHGHCHHKTAGIQSAVKALNLPPGYDATLIDAGCCGMAGAFGFEREHYELSRQIGEDRLFGALEDDPAAEVAVSGVSCRQQIEHFTGRAPKHLVEWLAEDLDR